MKNLPLSLLLLTSVLTPNLGLIAHATENQPVILTKAFFSKAPRLVDYYTTFNGVSVRRAIYYFDLEIPDDAVGSLKEVMIAQRGGVEEIEFRLDKTKAFVGNHRRRKESINLSSVTQDASTKIIKVTFEQPVEPGSKITIGLKPRINPDTAGFYLFGVTAIPAGEQPTGLYLGVARFYFDRGGNSGLD